MVVVVLVVVANLFHGHICLHHNPIVHLFLGIIMTVGGMCTRYGVQEARFVIISQKICTPTHMTQMVPAIFI